MAKKKKCKNPDCREWYQPWSSLQKACSPACALVVGRQEQERKEKRELRHRKEKLKTRQDWLREAQAEFNKYIRLRDAALPCISCGRHHEGQWHAGHYRSVGACSSLRFDESNVQKQCMPCNAHKSGNVVEYRINLIERIGESEVERLETTNAMYPWSIEEAKTIKSIYREKCRELEKS